MFERAVYVHYADGTEEKVAKSNVLTPSDAKWYMEHFGKEKEVEAVSIKLNEDILRKYFKGGRYEDYH